VTLVENSRRSQQDFEEKKAMTDDLLVSAVL